METFRIERKENGEHGAVYGFNGPLSITAYQENQAIQKYGI
jgi:hypothetical protein